MAAPTATPESVAEFLLAHPDSKPAALRAHFKKSDSYLRRLRRQAVELGLLGAADAADDGDPSSGAGAAPGGAAGPAGGADAADPGGTSAAATGGPPGAAGASDRRVDLLAPRRRGLPSSSFLAARSAADLPRRKNYMRPGMVARARTWWLCPRCEQLMPVVPGTKSDKWNESGCYLHAAQPAAAPAEPAAAESVAAEPAAADASPIDNALQPDPAVPVAADPAVPVVPVAASAAEFVGSGSGSAPVASQSYKNAVPVPASVPVPVASMRDRGLDAGRISSAARRRAGVKNKTRWPGLVPVLLGVGAALLGVGWALVSWVPPRVLLALAVGLLLVLLCWLSISGSPF